MKAHLITYGCQMNEYDTHLVQSQLVSFGADIVESPDEADFVLVNTCAVRGKPVDKVRSLLGDLRKQKAQRSLVVGMMGCLAQLEEGQQIARKFEVDVLLGPGSLLDIGAALESNERFWGLQFKDELHDHIPPPPSGKLQAHLTIMRGCDHHCTYCIVPTTRGPQVSRHPDDILRELDMQLAAGVREVTLLGQNVNAYGVDQGAKLKGYPSFADLLRMVGASGIERVKFTTSHPMNFTEDVAAAIGETPAICEFVHLPVQSGSDRVLRRMAREYNREKYLTHIAQIKKHIPDVVLATDIIVGFPGETEEDFQELLQFLEDARLDRVGAFPYSDIEEADANALPGAVPEEVKQERLARFMEVAQRISTEKLSEKVGRVMDVIIDEFNDDEDDQPGTRLIGRTKGDAPGIDGQVYLYAGDFAGLVKIGDIVRARIEDSDEYDLFGEVIEKPEWKPNVPQLGHFGKH